MAEIEEAVGQEREQGVSKHLPMAHCGFCGYPRDPHLSAVFVCPVCGGAPSFEPAPEVLTLTGPGRLAHWWQGARGWPRCARCGYARRPDEPPELACRVCGGHAWGEGRSEGVTLRRPGRTQVMAGVAVIAALALVWASTHVTRAVRLARAPETRASVEAVAPSRTVTTIEVTPARSATPAAVVAAPTDAWPTTETPTPAPTAIPPATPTAEPSLTPEPSATATAEPTATTAATATTVPTETAIPTATPQPTATPPPTATFTPSRTSTPSPTATETATATATPSLTPTRIIASPETVRALRAAVEESLGDSNRRDVARVIKLAVYDQPEGARVFVDWSINRGDTTWLTRTGAQIDVLRILRAIQNEGMVGDELAVQGNYALLGESGTLEEAIVLVARYTADVVTGTDWERVSYDGVAPRAEQFWLHESLAD